MCNHAYRGIKRSVQKIPAYMEILYVVYVAFFDCFQGQEWIPYILSGALKISMELING
jgi:diacylglycerol kinase